jgi:peptidoglycan/xylan/chitin deacetylase (PgdA/CDA1 family)
MKKVALVFDDGPHAEQRMKMLAVLERLKIRITFACVGKQIEARPDLAEAAAKAGHEQVNHSYSHAHCNELDATALEKELTRAGKLLEQTAGQPSPWFWPPYGECDARCNATVESLGLKSFLALGFPFVSTRDWDVNRDAQTVFKSATTGVQDGAIIVFHEWRIETLEILPAIVAELRSQGFEFVTFSELAEKTASPDAVSPRAGR